MLNRKKKNLIKAEDIILGTDEMKYWKDLIDAKKRDIEISEQNLKFYKFIVKYAEMEYKKAEDKFNKK